MTALINKLAEVSFGLDSSSEPALLAIGVVLVARYFFRQPHDLRPAEEIRAEHFFSPLSNLRQGSGSPRRADVTAKICG